MKKKSSKYSTPRGRANLTPGRKGKPNKPDLVFPSEWETFCVQYVLTGNRRLSAMRAGYHPDYASLLLKHPAIPPRIAELRAQGHKATEKVLLAAARRKILHLEFVDEQTVDIIQQGEDGEGTGRVRMIDVAYRRLGAIQPGGNVSVSAKAAAMAGSTAGQNTFQVYESAWLRRRNARFEEQLEAKHGLEPINNADAD